MYFSGGSSTPRDHLRGINNLLRQECIPVGCVPPASVAVSGWGVCLGRGVSAQGVYTPPP